MEDLNKLLQQCDKTALMGVVKNLCDVFQEQLNKIVNELEENDGNLGNLGDLGCKFITAAP
jgi:hypothetical protein